MLPENFTPFLLFALAGSLSPGPNNMISTASGAAFGFARTLPQMLGVSIGYPAMVIALGLGLGEVFRLWPWLHNVLRVAGAAYMLYLAWRIVAAARPERAEAARPFGFFEAVIFQWLNPKAWALALGLIAAFTTPGAAIGAFLGETSFYAVVSGIVTFPCLALWCLFGVAISRALEDARKRRIFSLSLAGLLAASVVFLFI